MMPYVSECIARGMDIQEVQNLITKIYGGKTNE